MRIAYLTFDEVNHYQAQQWADARGMEIDLVTRADEVTADRHAALVIDLDCFPRVAEVLRSVPETLPVAVHGYHLSDEQTRALNDHSVAVFRRLGRRLLERAARVATYGETWPAEVVLRGQNEAPGSAEDSSVMEMA